MEFKFQNGYSASVTADDGIFELSSEVPTAETGWLRNLTDRNVFPDGVMKHLTSDAVVETLAEIKSLQHKNSDAVLESALREINAEGLRTMLAEDPETRPEDYTRTVGVVERVERSFLWDDTFVLSLASDEMNPLYFQAYVFVREDSPNIHRPGDPTDHPWEIAGIVLWVEGEMHTVDVQDRSIPGARSAG